MAIEAFKMKPGDIPSVLILNRATLYPELNQRIAAFAIDYLEDIDKNGDEYRQENGFGGKVGSGLAYMRFSRPIRAEDP